MHGQRGGGERGGGFKGGIETSKANEIATMIPAIYPGSFRTNVCGGCVLWWWLVGWLVFNSAYTGPLPRYLSCSFGGQVW